MLVYTGTERFEPADTLVWFGEQLMEGQQGSILIHVQGI